MPATTWTAGSQTNADGWSHNARGRGDLVIVLLAVPVRQAPFFDSPATWVEGTQSATTFVEGSQTASTWTDGTF